MMCVLHTQTYRKEACTVCADHPKCLHPQWPLQPLLVSIVFNIFHIDNAHATNRLRLATKPPTERNPVIRQVLQEDNNETTVMNAANSKIADSMSTLLWNQT